MKKKLMLFVAMFFSFVVYADDDLNWCGPESKFGNIVVVDYFRPTKTFWYPFSPSCSIPIAWATTKKANFGKWCKQHDTCYSTHGNNKKDCDQQLRNSLSRECDFVWGPRHNFIVNGNALSCCQEIAWSYYEGVDKFGGSAFLKAQNDVLEIANRLLLGGVNIDASTIANKCTSYGPGNCPKEKVIQDLGCPYNPIFCPPHRIIPEPGPGPGPGHRPFDGHHPPLEP